MPRLKIESAFLEFISNYCNSQNIFLPSKIVGHDFFLVLVYFVTLKLSKEFISTRTNMEDGRLGT